MPKKNNFQIEWNRRIAELMESGRCRTRGQAIRALREADPKLWRNLMVIANQGRTHAVGRILAEVPVTPQEMAGTTAHTKGISATVGPQTSKSPQQAWHDVCRSIPW